MNRRRFTLCAALVAFLFIIYVPTITNSGSLRQVLSLPNSFAAGCCNYNFSVSPGTYNMNTGVWSVPPNTKLTVNSSTNDVSVTLINMTGTLADGYRFTVQSSPTSCGNNCLFVSTTIPASNDKSGDTWSITANFTKGSGPSHMTRAEIFPTVIATPEFPFGTVLAIGVPITTLGLYILLARRYSLVR